MPGDTEVVFNRVLGLYENTNPDGSFAGTGLLKSLFGPASDTPVSVFANGTYTEFAQIFDFGNAAIRQPGASGSDVPGGYRYDVAGDSHVTFFGNISTAGSTVDLIEVQVPGTNGVIFTAQFPGPINFAGLPNELIPAGDSSFNWATITPRLGLTYPNGAQDNYAFAFSDPVGVSGGNWLEGNGITFIYDHLEPPDSAGATPGERYSLLLNAPTGGNSGSLPQIYWSDGVPLDSSWTELIQRLGLGDDRLMTFEMSGMQEGGIFDEGGPVTNAPFAGALSGDDRVLINVWEPGARAMVTTGPGNDVAELFFDRAAIESVFGSAVAVDGGDGDEDLLRLNDATLADFDLLVTRVGTENDPEKRLKIYQQIEQLTLETDLPGWSPPSKFWSLELTPASAPPLEQKSIDATDVGAVGAPVEKADDDPTPTLSLYLSGFELLQLGDVVFDLVAPARTVAPTYGQTDHFLFDSVFYKLANAPAAAAGVTLETAWDHFRTVGAAEGLQPHPDFDAAYYESAWADLQSLGLDDLTLFQHWNLYGIWEGRRASEQFALFDGPRYLEDYPDVALYVDAHLPDFLGSRTNGAIAHFTIFGSEEQRVAYTTDGLERIDLGYTIELDPGLFV